MPITLQGIDFEITGTLNSRTASNIDKITNSLKNLKSTMSNAKLGSAYKDASTIGSDERASGTGEGSGGNGSAKRMSSLLSSLKESKREFKSAGQAASEFYNSLKRIAMYRALRTALKLIAAGAKEGANNLYQFSKAGGDFGVFAASMDSIATSFQYLKNSVGAAISPIINMLAPALDWLIDKLVSVINLINQVLAILSGAGSWNKALKYPKEYAAAAGSATGKVKELQKTILGFDEINKLNGQPNTGGGGGVSGLDYSKMFEVSEFQGKMAQIAALIQKHMVEVEAILAAFEFALGAILMLTGHPIIGLAMMAHGAYKLFDINGKIEWGSISTEMANVLAMIEGVVAGFALSIGLLLLLTGTNIPLGIAMVAVGAAMLWQAVSVNWKATEADLTTALATIMGVAIGAVLGLGVLLLITGAAPGLGLACIIAGLAGIATEVAFNWNSAQTETGKQLQTITGIIGGALLAVGAILVLTGHFALGLGAMIAGAAVLFAAATVDWDTAGTNIKDKLQDIGLAAGGALMAIGLIFFLTGHFLLGIGAMGAGASLYFTAGEINWDAATEKIEKTFEKIKQKWDDFKGWFKEKWEGLKSWWQGLSLGEFKIPKPEFHVIGGFGWNGHSLEFPSIDVKWKANGGFLNKGDLFVANERGAEMVGSMNGRTAVANNQQIVDGIRQGVRDANESEVALLKEQNDLLRAILEKEGNVEIPLSSITSAMARKNQRDGGTFVPVG